MDSQKRRHCYRARQEILNEILDDVRKYRAYLVYKGRKKPRHTAPKFNFWDMRDSIEQTLNKLK
tara:strand:+ start:266 stop:457 length:192 start_codon:yes stop_codon:yes gene_type:complete